MFCFGRFEKHAQNLGFSEQVLSNNVSGISEDDSFWELCLSLVLNGLLNIWHGVNFLHCGKNISNRVMRRQTFKKTATDRKEHH